MGAAGEIEGSQQAVNHYGAEKGEFSVAKDGEVLYDPGRGYLTLAAAIPEKGKEGKIVRILIFP